jgi:hypothetical protein
VNNDDHDCGAGLLAFGEAQPRNAPFPKHNPSAPSISAAAVETPGPNPRITMAFDMSRLADFWSGNYMNISISRDAMQVTGLSKGEKR